MGDRVKSKNLCRIIRTYAQHKLKGTPENKIWEDIQKGSEIDYQPLFNEMREDTIKKVGKLLDANDHTRLVERSMRMTSTNWLMYDLILVHEDLNVIGPAEAVEVPSALKILIFLVKKHGIEDKDADTVFDAWLNLYVDYNGDGRYCSPMLLQKRWYQTKSSTRSAFYAYWYNHYNNLKAAKEKPGALQVFVAKQFPSIITKPFVDWKKLYEKKMIMVLEQIDKVMGPNKHQGDTDADVLIVEPTIEVIDITDPEEDKDKVTEQLVPKNNEQEQPSNTDVNNASPAMQDINITITDNEMYSGGNDDMSNVPEVDANMEETLTLQEVTISTEDNLNDQNKNEISKSNNSVPNNSTPQDTNLDDNDVMEILPETITSEGQIANTIEVKTHLEKTSLHEFVKSTECNFKDQKQTEPVPPKTLNSTVSVSENSILQDSNVDDDDIIEILPSIKSEEIMEIDGLCNVKIVDASHVDQYFQDSNKSVTDMTLLNHKETEKKVCVTDEGTQNKDYSNEICMSQLEIVDDGIEFDEDDIILPIDNKTSNHSPLDFQGSHDDSSQEDSDGGIDSKLIMLPIVYTVKVDDIQILKNKSLTNLDLKDIEDKIIGQSKPQLKQTITGLIKSEPIDIDNDVIEQETIKSISPVPDLYYCKYIRRLLKVPRKRSYNPVLLCKNPDFNTRLRRLSAGFLSIVRNCKLLKTLKPLTIDLNKAFEHELVNGTLYVPKGVDIIGTCSNVNTKGSSALLPTAMHVQSLIDNSQPISEDHYSSSMIYKIPSKNKSILSNDVENEPHNITLLQYNSATTQVEKEISLVEPEKINTAVKQAQNMSTINSSAVDCVLDNYLNNLNKNSTAQNITDQAIETPNNYSTNDIKDLAIGSSTVSYDVFKNQNEDCNQVPIKCDNNIIENDIKQNKTDKQTIDDPMTSNDNEPLAQLPENKSTHDAKVLALDSSSGNDYVLNKEYDGIHVGVIECNNDNNQQNIISNKVGHHFEDETISSEAITDNTTEKCDIQLVTANNNKQEKNKLKIASKRLKTTNRSTPWYVHKYKKINYLEEDRLLTECSLKRMLTALNAIEPEKPIEKAIQEQKNKLKKCKFKPKTKPNNTIVISEEKKSSCSKITNSKRESQKSDSGIHSCGTDLSETCCMCSNDKANDDIILHSSTKDIVEETSSVNTLLTEHKSDDINCITTEANPKIPKFRLRVNKNKKLTPRLRGNTIKLSASKSIFNNKDCDSNITPSESNSNAIMNYTVSNISIESNNGIISIDGSINTLPNSTILDPSQQCNAIPVMNTTFNSTFSQSTQSIGSIDNNTNLFIMKPLTSKKSPIKLSDDKILLTTANFDEYVPKTPSSNTFNEIEKKDQAPATNSTNVNLKPSHNEVTYDINVTDKSNDFLTPSIQENLLPNNITNQTNLINEIVTHVSKSADFKDAATSNDNTKNVNIGTDEKQNEANASIECLPATVSNVENDKKSILSDLMEMAGISAADTTYDNTVFEPTPTANETDSVPILTVPTLSPIYTLNELKWALLQKAKFYSLNVKTGGLASIAIEMVKKSNTAPIVISDDHDDHNYLKTNIQKNVNRVYMNKNKKRHAWSEILKPRILKRRLFTGSVYIRNQKRPVLNHNIIDLDSSDDDKSEKIDIEQRSKQGYVITKLAKPAHDVRFLNASPDVKLFSITNLKEKPVTATELPDNDEIAQITLIPPKVSETQNVESDDSSDDEPLSKKARVSRPVHKSKVSPESLTINHVVEECDPSNYEHVESEIGIDVISSPEGEDDDFILGV